MTQERVKQFWADQIAASLDPAKNHVVSDAKTPSGRIHVGALRGVLIHDVVYKAVKDAGHKAEFVYRFDDFDPMDGISEDLKEKYEPHMGEPLCDVPSPELGFRSYAQFFATEFQSVFERLGCHPRITWASDDYRKGGMNDVIRTAIEKAALVKEINERISGTRKEGGWLPIHVLCEQCGKIGTTRASDFDGKTAAYECAGAKYAKGCGHSGRRSPFDGGSKLTWKAHWAAQWKVYGVTVEGEGKDHSTVGGSREVTDALSKEIFGYAPPYDVPYEFFLMKGRKMSSSKGIGATATEMAEALAPEMLRFLMVRYKPRTAINFSPEGDTIPRLYDDYDSFAESFFGRRQSRDPDEPRIFGLSQVSSTPRDIFRPQFSLMAYLIQVPHINHRNAFENKKGLPLSMEEIVELERRERAARQWLEKYAGPESKIKMLDHAEAVKRFAALQPEAQRALHEFGDLLAGTCDERMLGQGVKLIAEKHGIAPEAFYKAAYDVFLGSEKGPRLLPFLNALEKAFVVQRLQGVA